jgi:DNA-binding Xre family transcriptional regulator
MFATGRRVLPLLKGISNEVLEKICAALNCQPVDIMEYVKDTPNPKKGKK